MFFNVLSTVFGTKQVPHKLALIMWLLSNRNAENVENCSSRGIYTTYFCAVSNPYTDYF